MMQERDTIKDPAKLSGEEIDPSDMMLPAGIVEPRVSIVIPVLNEEQNLKFVLPRVPQDSYEVIVVDGHSTDSTVTVARKLCPDVRIVYQDGCGKGDALRCGFTAATGNIIVTLDGDGSHDASEIPRFVAAVYHGADFVKGSRFACGGGSSDITHIRRFGNQVLSYLVNRLYGTSYTDLCYGYNAFRRECLPFMNVDCKGFEVETLINVRIAKAGLIVHEVPSFERPRVHGLSNLKAARDGWRAFKVIVIERFRQGRVSRIRLIGPDDGRGYGWDGVERRSGFDRRRSAGDYRGLRRRGGGRRAADRSVFPREIEDDE